MNLIERQAAFARELAEINIAAMRQMADVAADGAHRYVKLNAQFASDVSQRRGISEFLASQRHYGQAVVAGVRTDLEQTGNVFRSLASQTVTALRDGFSASRERIEESVETGAEYVKDQAAEVQARLVDAIEDELERIDGIGEVYATQLREAGIVTLAQLAALNVDSLEDDAHPLSDLKGRMDSEEWVHQARALINPL